MNFDSQFFAQFPGQAGFKGFVGLALATGEFPQSAQVRIGVALGDQQLAVSENQAGGDVDDLHSISARCSCR